MAEYKVPAGWEPVFSKTNLKGDFIGDPNRVASILLGWKTPDGFVSPDKLPPEYIIPDPPRLQAVDAPDYKPIDPNAFMIVVAEEGLCLISENEMTMARINKALDHGHVIHATIQRISQ